MNKKTITILIISCCLFSIINLSVGVPPPHSNKYKTDTPSPPNDSNIIWSPYWKITYNYNGSFYMTLYTGWNMIGWFQNYSTTASNLSGNIEHCSSVSCWDAINQTYHTYIVGGPPTFDFQIHKGMGVFVDVTQQSIWYGT